MQSDDGFHQTTGSEAVTTTDPIEWEEIERDKERVCNTVAICSCVDLGEILGFEREDLNV